MLRNQDPQFEFFTILNMNTYVIDLIRCIPDRLTEAFLDLFKSMQNMFAGAKGVFPEIRARTLRIASFPTP
jgi:hypothetical protein